MQRKTWYFFLLLLPVLIPFLCFLLQMALAFIFGQGGKSDTLTAIMLIGILQIIAYPQYALFCLGVWVWGRQRSADQIKRLSWFMPLLFIPIFSGLLILYNGISGKLGSAETIFTMPLLGSAFVIVIGYSYVILAHLLTILFQKIGWVID